MKVFKILEESDIRKKLSMRKAIDLMRDAFIQISKRNATVPVRLAIDETNKKGRVLFMPAYSPDYHLFGLKMVSVFPDNPQLNLPAIQGKILVMDDKQGAPLGMLDAEYVTALRTGAASGLASDVLANPDSRVLAVFGTGTQAITQVEAILCIRPIEEILVYGSSREKSELFCKALNQVHNILCKPGTQDSLKEADIICTATTSAQPLFELEFLKNSVHINGIGSYKPEIREIPSAVIKAARLIVDHRESAQSEAGDIIMPIKENQIQADHIVAELGEILLGSVVGRTEVNQITVFKSVGNAIQDLAVANYLIR